MNKVCSVNIFNLHNRKSIRHNHIAKVLHSSFNNTQYLDRYTLFSIAFIWHCQKHLYNDLFDKFCDDDSMYNILLTYQNIQNKKDLENFIKLSTITFSNIPPIFIRKIVQKFEEDNGEFGNIPHGFIASNYNVKELLNNFTKSMSFNLDDNDVSLIVNKLNIY